jgi:hypothetical protein
VPVEPAGGPSQGRTRRRLQWGAITAITTGFLVFGLVTAGSTHSAQPRATASQRTEQQRPSGLSASVAVKSVAPTSTSRATVVSAALGRTDVSKIAGSGSLLVIPALHVRAPLIPTGAAGAPETASLTIPADIDTVGWWDGTVRDSERTIHEDAPAPGQPGVAVIAGHVDSAAAGPGALYHLADLKVGDIIEISDSTGHLSTWTVDAAPQNALKSELPSALWATTGSPKLALVTCGGPFDPATGHYQDNVIVWAEQTN